MNATDEEKVTAWFEAMAEIPAETHKKVSLALHTDNPVILNILATDGAPQVRRNVAANRATTVEILKPLLTDRDTMVQIAAWCNRQVTYQMFLELEQEVDPEVWARVKFWILSPQIYPFID